MGFLPRRIGNSQKELVSSSFQAISNTKNPEISFYGGCSDVIAENYIRVVRAVSLQIISDSVEKL